MPRPSVTLVFLAYNRREKLRESLERMLERSDYDSDRVDAIVVDNASDDGTAEMVRERFPQVRLIARTENVGVSGWNDGFAEARGDWVLALDDDCYLPPDGLGRAVAAAEEHGADVVSFEVVSTYDREVFSRSYKTGLFSFWGCAVLIRRLALCELRGYDPRIFVWANELEFMLRAYDRGYRHLFLPEVVAHHMKLRDPDWRTHVHDRGYRINMRNWAYIAAKLFPPRHALGTLTALVATALRDGIRVGGDGFWAVPDALSGFLEGLRNRDVLRTPGLARFYRANFVSFASPWWFMRSPLELLRSYPRELLSRKPPRSIRIEQYFEKRARWYPDRAAALDFRQPGPRPADRAA